MAKKKIESKWKPVAISGAIINGSDDAFGGFAGLEVLENYDTSFLLGYKDKNKVNTYKNLTQ